jgi:hypothetical protein
MQIKNFPIATISIIVLNSIIFAVGLMSGEQTQIIRNYGFIPDHIFHPEQNLPSGPQSLSLDSLTRLFTSMYVCVYVCVQLVCISLSGCGPSIYENTVANDYKKS